METLKSSSEINKTAENTLYREIITDMSVPVCCFDLNGNITFHNEPFTNIFFSPEKPPSDKLNILDLAGEKEGKRLRLDLDMLTVSEPFGVCEHSFIGPDGQVSWYICKKQAVFDPDQKLVEYRLIAHEFNYHHLETEKLKRMSLRDELTGLYNRHFVIEELIRLDAEITPDNRVGFSHREHRVKPYSIIFCDLNDLKKINDTSADRHIAGDRLLKKTARIIQKSCRDYDLVARWGGDEFLILLPETSIKKATMVKDRISKFCLEKNIGLAMGVAQKGILDNFSQVVERADREMYSNKAEMKRATLSSI